MSIDVAGAIADAYGPAGAQPEAEDGVAGAIADARNFSAAPERSETPAAPVTRGQRFATGLGDMGYGLGQLAEHVAETPLNAVRKGIRASLSAVGANDAAELFHPVTSDDFDGLINRREQDYEESRKAAGQTGIDWWRLGGQAANPLNYVGGEGGAAATVGKRILQAGMQGAAVAAIQPTVNAPGSFWWEKTKNAALGFASGLGVGAAVEAAVPVLKAGVTAARKALGGMKAASSGAATVVVNDALRSKGIDPASVDMNLLGGMRQDVQSALEHGADPSATSIVNRAKAESLPVPVKLMRGQATGDPAQFSAEQNMRGITGVGEPLTARLQEQNAAFIGNLDALGAKDAPDPVSTSNIIAQKAQSLWDGLQSRKDQLYSAVRNSRGQPAMMDQFTAAKNIKDALDTPQASHAYSLLPNNIRQTIEDLEEGKLPLTVAQMQALDKQWGMAQRGAADGSIQHAIGEARRLLNDAPIQDDVGEASRKAYQAARQAHAQQMSLTEAKLPNGRPNPNFQPLVKAVVVDGKPPEKLFADHFMGAAPSVAGKNLAFLNGLDPNGGELVGRTLMGEIKRKALSSASDERGTVSQSELTGWARDPVKSARMDALLPKPQVATFRNLADVVEAAKRFPVASTVNTSNTGSTVVNAAVSMVKQGAFSQVAKRLPLIKPVAEGMRAAAEQTRVQEALQPGVTLKSLLSATPSQAARRRLTARALVPASAEAMDQLSGGANDQ